LILQKKAILFINGQAPKILPNTDGYAVVACTDGAFYYLKENGFLISKLDFVSGDFDSHPGFEQDCPTIQFIATPNQDKTDFEKALELLIERECTSVDVFGGSGGEMDHYLGNLHVASKFAHSLEICFYDDDSNYFFAPNNLILNGVQEKRISLFPFPLVENIHTKGLKWELKGQNLEISKNMGIRNMAVDSCVEIHFDAGNLIVFVGK
jgi:thiamine pyrophosphokinase